jgi:Tfp pilus assembly protein PilV
MALRTSWPRQAGISLLEVILSLTLMGASVAGVNSLVQSYTAETNNAQVADQLRRTSDAYTGYIKDNYSTLLGLATDTEPVRISVDDLVSEGYLPTNSASTNIYKQSLCALVRNVNGSLQGLLITEDGDAINQADLGSIANKVGSRAGAILEKNENGNASTEITGVNKGWRQPIADHHNRNHRAPKGGNASKRCNGQPGKVQVTAGHLAVALWFENAFTQSSAMYRDAVPGSPQLNQMNTPLVLNAPQTVGAACTTPGAIANNGNGALLNCTGGAWQRTANSLYWSDPVNTKSALPTCNAASKGAVRVVTELAYAATHPSVYTCNGSTWGAVGKDVNGNLFVPGGMEAGSLTLRSVVTADSWCYEDQMGGVAVSASGELLVCQKRYTNNQNTWAWNWTNTNSASQCRTLTSGFDLNGFYMTAGSVCADVADPTNGPPGTYSSNHWWLVTSHGHMNPVNPYIYQTAKDFYSANMWTRSYQNHITRWSGWERVITESTLNAQRPVIGVCGPSNRTEWNANKDQGVDANNNFYTACSVDLGRGHWVISAAASKFQERYLDNALYINGTVVDVGNNLGDTSGTAPEIMHGVLHLNLEALSTIWIKATWGDQYSTKRYGPGKISFNAVYYGEPLTPR